MLRIAILASSPLERATLIISRRRSSVMGGRFSRSWVPSLEGLTPRSEFRMAFSTSPICEGSNGLMSTMRGSGMAIDAACGSGVCAP